MLRAVIFSASMLAAISTTAAATSAPKDADELTAYLRKVLEASPQTYGCGSPVFVPEDRWQRCREHPPQCDQYIRNRGRSVELSAMFDVMCYGRVQDDTWQHEQGIVQNDQREMDETPLPPRADKKPITQEYRKAIRECLDTHRSDFVTIGHRQRAIDACGKEVIENEHRQIISTLKPPHGKAMIMRADGSVDPRMIPIPQKRIEKDNAYGLRNGDTVLWRDDEGRITSVKVFNY